MRTRSQMSRIIADHRRSSHRFPLATYVAFYAGLLMLTCACGASPPRSSACATNRTEVDGVCVSDEVADYISCVRAQGAQLARDRRQSLSAAAGYEGTKAQDAGEVRDALEKRYSTSDSNTLEIIRTCANTLALTSGQPKGETVGAGELEAGRILFEDFSSHRVGTAPPGWLGTDRFAIFNVGGHRVFRCTEPGPARFVIPLQNDLPANFEVSVTFSRHDNFDGIGLEVGGLKAGFIWSNAFLNKSTNADQRGTRLTVTDMTVTFQRLDGINRLLFDGREVLTNRNNVEAARNIILVLDHNFGPLDCPDGLSIKQIAVISR